MSDFIQEQISRGRAAEEASKPSSISHYWRELLAGEFEASGVPLSATTNALAASLVVKSGAGLLFGISGFNNNAAAQFIQIFDAETLPADGAIPSVVIKAPANTTGNFSADWIFPGRFFSRGIVICNSSTAATKTIGAADCWFDAQYI